MVEVAQGQADGSALQEKLTAGAARLEEVTAQRDAEAGAKLEAERTLQDAGQAASAESAAARERVASLEQEVTKTKAELAELEALKKQSIVEFRAMEAKLEETQGELSRTHETLEAEVQAGVVAKAKHAESLDAVKREHATTVEEQEKDREMLQGQSTELAEALKAKEEEAVSASQALTVAKGENESLKKEGER